MAFVLSAVLLMPLLSSVESRPRGALGEAAVAANGNVMLQHKTRLTLAPALLESNATPIINAAHARFLMQATFGPTKSDVEGMPTSYAEWIAGQMALPVGSHREYWRARANPILVEGFDHNFNQRGPCEMGSRFHRHAFTVHDIKKPISISGGKIMIDGVLRTEIDPAFAGNSLSQPMACTDELPPWEDQSKTCATRISSAYNGCRDSCDWRSRSFCETTCYMVGKGYEGQDCSGDGWAGFEGFSGTICTVEEGVGRLVGISLAADNCGWDKKKHLPNPGILLSDAASATQTSLEFEAGFLGGDVLFLAQDSPGCGLGSTEFISKGGNTYRYDPRMAALQNTPESPMLLQSTQSPDLLGAPATFLNDGGCVVTPKESATDKNYVACGSPGEVANDPKKGHLWAISTAHRNIGGFRPDNEYDARYHGEGWRAERGTKQLVWIEKARHGEDQLRQRVAWALSQIVVVSDQADQDFTEMWVSFYDIFVRNAFGSYLDVLREVTYSPVMGKYLSYLWSRSYDVTRAYYPDENYAREIMQLFTIGLTILDNEGKAMVHPDGTDVQTYSNEHIMNFARVFTGFRLRPQRANIELRYKDNYIDPMYMRGDYHDVYPKPDLASGYLGDGMPLCADLPKQHFLAAGAEYEFVGYTYDGVAFEFSAGSALLQALCGGTPPSCSFERRRVLPSAVACHESECQLWKPAVFKVGDGYYEYVPPPCVHLYFYSDGKELVDDGWLSRKPKCVPQYAAAAKPTCCKGCKDEANGWMKNRGYTCENHATTWVDSNQQPRLTTSHCNKTSSQSWQEYKYCQLTCWRAGLGYEGDDCSVGEFQEDKLCGENEWADYSSAQAYCQAQDMELCSIYDWEGECPSKVDGWSGTPRWTDAGCGLRLSVHEDGKVSGHTSYHEQNKFTVYWTGDPAPAGESPVCEMKSFGVGKCKRGYYTRYSESLDNESCMAACLAEPTCRAVSLCPPEDENCGSGECRAVYRDCEEAGVWTSSDKDRAYVTWVKDCGETPDNVELTAVFSELPSKSAALEKLKIGAWGTGSLACQDPCSGDVKAWTSGSIGVDTVFEIQGKFYKNLQSLVHVRGSSFRNPPVFIAPGHIKQTGKALDRAALYEVESLLEHLFRHSNTAVFIGKKLIQRFTTSNPSGAYMSAVVDAFRTGTYDCVTYSGEYGDLGATMAAVLLHPEARSPEAATAGMLREPVLKLLHFMRSMEYQDKQHDPVFFKDYLDQKIGQWPYRSPTVFNYFGAMFQPANFADMEIMSQTGTVESQAAVTGVEPEPEPEPEPLYGPEFEVFTPPFAINLLNGMASLVEYGVSKCDGGLGQYGEKRECVQGTFNWTGPGGADATVQELDALLTGGRLTAISSEAARSAFEEYGTAGAQTAILLSPEFQTMGKPLPTGARTEPSAVDPTTPSDYKAVVMIMLAGGADTYNMLVPVNCPLYDEYAEARGNMAMSENSLIGIKDASGAQDCSDFGIHPSLSFISHLYSLGEAAFIANVGALVEPLNREKFKSKQYHTCAGLFSHFHQQQAAQTLACEAPGGAPKGVGGRMADALGAMGKNVASFSVDGHKAWSDGFNTSIEIVDRKYGAIRFKKYESYKRTVDTLTKQTFDNMFLEEYARGLADHIKSSEILGEVFESTELLTTFQSENVLSEQLKQAALLIKGREARRAERDFFFVQIGGWDTHADQTNTLRDRFVMVDDAVKDFVAEMKEQSIFESVVIVTASDFGRTLSSNGAGTDHGWGGNHMVISGSLKGGRIFNTFLKTYAADSEYDSGRQRVIPQYPWESVMAPIAEWTGVTNLPFVFPNIGHFNSSHIIRKASLFNA